MSQADTQHLELHTRFEQDLDRATESSKEVPELSTRLSSDDNQMDNISSSDDPIETKKEQALRVALDAKTVIARTRVAAQQATVLIDDTLTILYEADKEGCIIGVPYGATDQMRSTLLSSRDQMQDALRSAERSEPSIDELITTSSK
jgi:hypothetical protein